MLPIHEDIEKCFEGGWSDGLPVVPPYATLVDRMLGGMGWRATDVVGEIKEQGIEIRAEHLAAAAVMAGCKWEFARLLRPLGEALLAPAFNLSGVEVTTGGVAALVIVSGPVVEELGFEHRANALGANNRANATVGRFAAMVRYFCGKGGGALESHGTIGHPGRLSFCIAEHPTTVWAPFHTQLGLASEVSAVTVMSTEGPNSVNNHYGMTGTNILETIADVVASYGSTNWYYRNSGYLIVIAPDHMALVGRDYSREDAARFVYERAVRPTAELFRLGRLPQALAVDASVVSAATRSPMSSMRQIHFIECGKEGGKFSAVIPRWVANRDIVSKVVPRA
jgi:hypothetical protein